MVVAPPPVREAGLGHAGKENLSPQGRKTRCREKRVSKHSSNLLKGQGDI